MIIAIKLKDMENKNDFWSDIVGKVSKTLHSLKNTDQTNRLGNFLGMLKDYYTSETYQDDDKKEG